MEIGSSRAFEEGRQLLQLVSGRPVVGRAAALKISKPGDKIPALKLLRDHSSIRSHGKT